MTKKSPEKIVKTLLKLHKDPAAARSFLRSENPDPDTLIEVSALLADRTAAAESAVKASESMQTQMALDYKKVEAERNALKSEVKKIRNDYTKLLEHYRLNSKVIFGDRAEDMDKLFEKMSRTLKLNGDGNGDAMTQEQFQKWLLEKAKRKLQKEAEKEAEKKAKEKAEKKEEAHGSGTESSTGSAGTNQKNGKGSAPQGGGSGEKKTRKRMDTSKLKRFDNYVFDPEVCNEIYGEGNYRIVTFEEKVVYHYSPERYWKEVIHYPVVVGKPLNGGDDSGSEEKMMRCKPDYDFWPHSSVSADLTASIMYKKCVDDQPYYRQTHDMGRQGLPIPRNQLSTLCIRTTQMYLDPAALQQEKLLKEQDHNQCDETPLKVNDLGRKAWIWCHCSSELYEGNKICVYKYEPTRKADHLRRFYEACRIILECDAYTGYDSFERRATLADGSGGATDVKLAHCWMHARRYFFDAGVVVNVLLQQKKDEISAEQLAEMPEVRAIGIIADIYFEEGQLRNLPADKRLAGRQKNVKPCVEEFFDYIESLDLTNPGYSAKLVQAVRYALTHKKGLCEFLDDPLIPLDDGFTERMIKKLAMLRRNCLFCDSEEGARTTSVQMTLCQTALLNGADPEIYLRYCLEEGARHYYDRDDSYLSDLVPWSDAYKDYEKRTMDSLWDPIGTGLTSEKPTVKKRMRRSA